MPKGRLRALTLVLAAALALPASAIELSPIQVHSRHGEPFVAEIRLRDAPADLQDVSARLPDPVVFARIGLPRPSGAVSQFRFDVRRNAQGVPVIRITSVQPVDEEFLTFLVQVDGGGTSLVREFSVALPVGAPPPALRAPVADGPPAPPEAAAVDAPQAVDPARVDSPAPTPVAVAPQVPAMPPPEASEAPPIAVIARTPPPQPAPQPAEPAPIPFIPRAPAPAPASSTGAPARVFAAPAPAPAPAPAAAPATTAARPAAARDATPVPAAAPAPPGAATIVVRPGNNLSTLARQAAPEGVPLDTVLVAFLLENPDAFIGNDINRLKRDATLRMPSAETLAGIDPERARVLVALQDERWRDGGDEARRQSIDEALAALQADRASRTPATPPRPQQVAAPARMKIVPVAEDQASGDPADASARVSTDPALQDEVLAARNMEIEHLQKKVAELERNYEEQRALIAMQNEALAAARQHMAPSDGGLPGILRWGWGLIVLVLGALAFAFFGWRRRSARTDAVSRRRALPELAPAPSPEDGTAVPGPEASSAAADDQARPRD